MAPSLRPFTSRIRGLAVGLCTSAALAAFCTASLSASPCCRVPREVASASGIAAEFTAQPDAHGAALWLNQNIPAGTTLADAPQFFASAHEVFYDAEENVIVFVYRSTERGRWMAWVSFDAERVGVVHTDTLDL